MDAFDFLTELRPMQFGPQAGRLEDRPKEVSVLDVSDGELAQAVRQACGVKKLEDARIADAVRGYITAQDHWYIRVLREAVTKYRSTIIGRISPTRRMELEGKSPKACAEHLVAAYRQRNYLTAEGWVFEELAIRLCPHAHKAVGKGWDIERYNPETGERHLTTLKSGRLTANCDSRNATKLHSKRAGVLMQQTQTEQNVVRSRAAALGRFKTTWTDGIRKPSSALFWSEITGLPEDEAMRLVFLGIVTVAVRYAKDRIHAQAERHLKALETLTAAYMHNGCPDTVDWLFLTRRAIEPRISWRGEDKVRHLRAIGQLAATDYYDT